jgi:hypothetical protein
MKIDFGSIVGIAFIVIVIGLFLYEMIPTIYSGLKSSKSNIKLEKELREKYGLRLTCINCTYCKKKLHRPFYTSMQLASYVPTYCRKLKIPLGSNTTLCQAENPEQAERVNTTTHYNPNGMFFLRKKS